jgi:hypothetical protein
VGSNPTLSESTSAPYGAPAGRLDAPGTVGRYDVAMDRTEHRFVVHMWLEQGESAEGQWRGAVDHVGSGRRIYFSSLADLTDFIRIRLDSGRAAPLPRDRAST